MNIDIIRQHALPGDFIETGGYGVLSTLMKYGQLPISGHSSDYSHNLFYIDSETVAESTMDFLPYNPTGRRFDNGPQFNTLDSLKDVSYGRLISLRALTNVERQLILNNADAIIKSGEYRYSVTGLFGSLASYWLLNKLGLGKYNHLAFRDSYYCSAFIQACVKDIGIEFTTEHSARNTAPEHIHLWSTRKENIQRWDIQIWEL